MAPLNRALALPQMDDLAVMVPHDLKLDVPRRSNVFLDVNIRGAKGRRGLVARGLEGAGQLLRQFHDAHSPAPASGRRFDHNGVTDSRGNLPRLRLGVNHLRPWQHGQA